MSTPAQILANQTNAQLSTGPRTEEGKARVSRNSTKLGLFSAAAFVPPEQRALYYQFLRSYVDNLTPQGPVEDTLADEVTQAAWRLRRCNELEARQLSGDEDPADLERIQISIDRARATAQRSYFRSLNELRRVQSERVYRQVALPENLQIKAIGQAECRRLDLPGVNERQTEAKSLASLQRGLALGRECFAQALSAKQTQLAPEPQTDFAERSQFERRSIPRNAQCPCGSGEKYKRCCGKDAPPVLGRAA